MHLIHINGHYSTYCICYVEKQTWRLWNLFVNLNCVLRRQETYIAPCTRHSSAVDRNNEYKLSVHRNVSWNIAPCPSLCWNAARTSVTSILQCYDRWQPDCSKLWFYMPLCKYSTNVHTAYTLIIKSTILESVTNIWGSVPQLQRRTILTHY